MSIAVQQPARLLDAAAISRPARSGPRHMLRKLVDDKVSLAGARDDYGVVVTGPPDDPQVDEPASDALRSARRAARTGAEPFFDRGPGYAMLAGQPSADIDQA